MLQEALPKLVEERKIDCVIVDAENATDGAGLSAAAYEKVIAAGAHVITLGDHVFRRKEIIPIMEKSERIVRPANLPVKAPGREVTIYQTADGVRVAVMIVLGRMFMKIPADDPFAAVDRVRATLPREVKVVVGEVHAETTSVTNDDTVIEALVGGAVAADFRFHVVTFESESYFHSLVTKPPSAELLRYN